MLWTIFVILLVLWLFGLVSSYTLGEVHPSRLDHCRGRAGHQPHSGPSDNVALDTLLSCRLP